jgi:TctA family transporter
MILGIPTNAVIAILMGALIIHGVKPGPDLMDKYPDIFWGFIVSMYIGNVMLLVLNLPLIGIWVKVLTVPYKMLFPLILLFCMIGVYTLNNNAAEIFIMLIFGVVGYLNRKINFEGAPFILALVLGPLMEKSLRQSLLISHGDLGIFFVRPISVVLIGLGIASIVFSILSSGTKEKHLGAEVD